MVNISGRMRAMPIDQSYLCFVMDHKERFSTRGSSLSEGLVGRQLGAQRVWVSFRSGRAEL